MTYKKFRIIKMAIVIILAITISQAITYNNYWLAGGAVLLSFALVLGFKKQVREITADERDYKNAGDAARWTLTIFASLTAIASVVFISMREIDFIYEAIGIVLAYSACGVMFLYSFIYIYLNKTVPTGRKVFFYIAATVTVVVFTLAGLRLFTAEDTWMCEGGQWIKHGQPNAAMPVEPCTK